MYYSYINFFGLSLLRYEKDKSQLTVLQPTLSLKHDDYTVRLSLRYS